MDIPACTTASEPTSPPPSYNNIDDFPLYEEILDLPPPSYTSATTPIDYREIQSVKEIPQYPNGSGANPYPILNVPSQNAVPIRSEQGNLQQFPQNPTRSANQYPVPNYPTQTVQRENFQQIPQNPMITNPNPVNNLPPQTAMYMHSQQQVIMQHGQNPPNPQVIMIQPRLLDDVPTPTVCQHCHQSIVTKVKYRPGCAAWGMCILLSVLGLICGFCLIPFCVNGFQDAHHSCPNCNRHIGVYTRK